MQVKFSRIFIISFSIMLVVSSLSLLHSNEVEFILDRFEGLSDFQFSLYDSVLYASYLVFGLILGFFVMIGGGRKPFILIGAFGTFFLTLVLTCISNYYLLLLLRFVQGFFAVMAWQTLMTLILDYSDDSNRGRNMGVFGFFMAFGMGFTPVLGGLIAKISVFAPYYFSSFLSFLSFLIIWIFVSDVSIENRESKPSLFEIISFFKHRKRIFVPALFNFVDRLHMGFIIFILPLMLNDLLGLGPEYRGMMLGINGIAYILLQYPIGKLSDKYGRLRFLILGSIGYAVILIFCGIFASFGLVALIPLFLLLGVFSGLTGPPNNALVGDLIHKSENPLAMGVFNLFGNIGMMLGPLLGGLILSLDIFGKIKFQASFISAGIIELVSLFIGIFIYFSLNDTPAIKKGGV